MAESFFKATRYRIEEADSMNQPEFDYNKASSSLAQPTPRSRDAERSHLTPPPADAHGLRLSVTGYLAVLSRILSSAANRRWPITAVLKPRFAEWNQMGQQSLAQDVGRLLKRSVSVDLLFWCTEDNQVSDFVGHVHACAGDALRYFRLSVSGTNEAHEHMAEFLIGRSPDGIHGFGLVAATPPQGGASSRALPIVAEEFDSVLLSTHRSLIAFHEKLVAEIHSRRR